MRKEIIVEVIPATEVPAGSMARLLGSKETPLKLLFGTKYPKAMKSMLKLKRMAGSKWKAIKSSSGYEAVELIK